MNEEKNVKKSNSQNKTASKKSNSQKKAAPKKSTKSPVKNTKVSSKDKNIPKVKPKSTTKTQNKNVSKTNNTNKQKNDLLNKTITKEPIAIDSSDKIIKQVKDEPIEIKLLKDDAISKKTVVLICLVVLLAFIVVMFLPKIYVFVEKLKAPEVIDIDRKEEEEEEIKITDELLEELAYPVMRYSKYESNSYYMKDEFTLKDMSNRDILYTAFLDVYEGNITNSEFAALCTDSPKKLKTQYIELRIKNILSKTLEYKLENFIVPLDSDSNYKGEWKYEGTYFTYQGNCNLNALSIEYYDLREYKEAYFEKDNLIVYYYIGFAKVENGNYIIYSDPNYTKELISGEFVSEEELDKVFRNLKRNKKQLYKYEFNTTKCSYNNYCLTKGMWVNG